MDLGLAPTAETMNMAAVLMSPIAQLPNMAAQIPNFNFEPRCLPAPFSYIYEAAVALKDARFWDVYSALLRHEFTGADLQMGQVLLDAACMSLRGPCWTIEKFWRSLKEPLTPFQMKLIPVILAQNPELHRIPMGSALDPVPPHLPLTLMTDSTTEIPRLIAMTSPLSASSVSPVSSSSVHAPSPTDTRLKFDRSVYRQLRHFFDSRGGVVTPGECLELAQKLRVDEVQLRRYFSNRRYVAFLLTRDLHSARF
ncbi:unnamed protein product [Caenorhabditis sp. 36 PRJEB53466]|nr:unnamed protein product [Caenorhabditis sp. 36 PRJEB53466]